MSPSPARAARLYPARDPRLDLRPRLRFVSGASGGRVRPRLADGLGQLVAPDRTAIDAIVARILLKVEELVGRARDKRVM